MFACSLILLSLKIAENGVWSLCWNVPSSGEESAMAMMDAFSAGDGSFDFPSRREKKRCRECLFNASSARGEHRLHQSEDRLELAGSTQDHL